MAIGACGYLLWSNHPPSSHDPRASALQDQEKITHLEESSATLASKVAELEGWRELQRWGNEAIADGHRSAMDRLNAYFNAPEIQSLREAANAEIIRVESYFITTRRFRGYPAEMPFISETDPVGSLTQILLDERHHWSVRARAATLLGEQGEVMAAADALADACQADPNLYVLQETILAFAKITGFRSTGVFDSASVKDWWDKNRNAAE